MAQPELVRSTAALLTVAGLTMSIAGETGPVEILAGVDFEVLPGEAVGIVGESGSGKSMTLRCIARLTPAGAEVGGTLELGGTSVASLRGASLRDYRRRSVSTIFQDPRTAINPLQRIDEFLLEAVKDSGGDRAGARGRAVDLLTRMGITDPERRMRQYPYELSGGLLQRVMIASVLLASPALILADEPTTALDVTTQSDVLALTEELRHDQSAAMVFVTHDLDLALAICDKVAVLYAGRVLEMADADTLRTAARHPYTRGLLASRPPVDRRLETLPVIDGPPISASQAGAGCPFHPRCPVRLDVCATELPEVTAYPGGSVRCHRSDEIASGLDVVAPDEADQLSELGVQHGR
jgi:oligopeptide/dipeptide ABC transporter ATP-binding protein